MLTCHECMIAGGEFLGMDTTCEMCANLVQGDVNCDGVASFADINVFVQRLSDPAGWQRDNPGCYSGNADVNGDGLVDFADINPFVNLLLGR